MEFCNYNNLGFTHSNFGSGFSESYGVAKHVGTGNISVNLVIEWTIFLSSSVVSVTLEIGLARQSKSIDWKFKLALVEFDAEGRKPSTVYH
jgi:hypothetical protein